MAARLSTGLTIAGKDMKLLEIDALGLVVVTNLGFNAGDSSPRLPKIAMRLDLSVYYALPGIELSLKKAQLLLNTTGQNVIYVVPDRLQERIETLQVRRGRTHEDDPDFLSPVPIDDAGVPLLPLNSAGKPIDSNGDVIPEEDYDLGFIIPGASHGRQRRPDDGRTLRAIGDGRQFDRRERL